MKSISDRDRITCPVCKGTQRVRPMDENFQRTLPEEDCVDCTDGTTRRA